MSSLILKILCVVVWWMNAWVPPALGTPRGLLVSIVTLADTSLGTTIMSGAVSALATSSLTTPASALQWRQHVLSHPRKPLLNLPGHLSHQHHLLW